MLKSKHFLIASFSFFVITSIAAYAQGLYSDITVTLRWLTALAFVGYGYKQKSLTAWIFVSMVVGTAVGLDFPELANNLKVLSSIFLKFQIVKVSYDLFPFWCVLPTAQGLSSFLHVFVTIVREIYNRYRRTCWPGIVHKIASRMHTRKYYHPAVPGDLLLYISP